MTYAEGESWCHMTHTQQMELEPHNTYSTPNSRKVLLPTYNLLTHHFKQQKYLEGLNLKADRSWLIES